MRPWMMCCGDSAANGISKVSSSHSTMPRLHTSAFSDTCCGSLTTSGAMYGSVPLPRTHARLISGDIRTVIGAELDVMAQNSCNKRQPAAFLRQQYRRRKTLAGLGKGKGAHLDGIICRRKKFGLRGRQQGIRVQCKAFRLTGGP